MTLTSQAAHAQSAPAPTAAESAIAGRVLASNCANCHGMDGRSAGGMPMLAGYPRDAMVSTMQAFRSGQRPATIMHQLAKGYTDDQIALVAEHFSRLKALP
ncbi:MAG: cytochrome C [Betaproteobacteria bacterium]|nr:cytochrome C [Betaproteobacteria bacterium]